MNGLHKFRKPHILKKLHVVFFACSDYGLSKLCTSIDNSYHFPQKARFFATTNSKNGENLGDLSRRSRIARTEAQSILFEYFHSTRGLQFLDAENMSKNTPMFFYALTNRVALNDDNVGRAFTRFLRYHPINEFEPFFESIGLKPSEYACYLPRNLMFINEDRLLLDNYHALCDYGIPRNNIGKIYKEATEIFRYENCTLKSKLEFFKDLNLKHTLSIKIIASSPGLLIGKMNNEFIEFLERLKRIGIEFDWLENHILVDDLYNWEHMLELISLFSKMGFSHDIQREMFMNHPRLLFELSGNTTFSVINFLLKFGCTLEAIQNAFLCFPRISVSKFASNLRRCYKVLEEMGMTAEEIGIIVRSHPTVLGSCKIKTLNLLMSQLTCGRDIAREIVKEDPEVLKSWVLHVKVEPIKVEKKPFPVKELKTDFLLSLGIKEKSEKMEKTLRNLRGSVFEIQERFDCLVKMGLSREEAMHIVKTSPEILNQTKNVIEGKINVFVKELGYPISDIVKHPKIVGCSIERIKVRLLLYKWLKEEKMMNRNMSLASILSSSESRFMRYCISPYEGALAYLNRLRREICCSASETSF